MPKEEGAAGAGSPGPTWPSGAEVWPGADSPERTVSLPEPDAEPKDFSPRIKNVVPTISANSATDPMIIIVLERFLGERGLLEGAVFCAPSGADNGACG